MSLFTILGSKTEGDDIVLTVETNDQHGVHFRPAAALLNSLRIEAKRHQITITLRVRMKEIDIELGVLDLSLMKIETREPFEVIVRNTVAKDRAAIARTIIDTLISLT